jgi:D-alanyl-lipoteichoic acid acyltransferase DltB (MBOAT superfamily)
MNFAEVRFWQLLLGALGLILLARYPIGLYRPGALGDYDKSMLACLGLFLLAEISLLTVLIFIFVLLSTYYGTRWVLKHSEGKTSRYLLFFIPLQLAPLFYYKYSNFVCNQALGLQIDAFRDLIIPVGISFYSFQAVGFLIDTLAFMHPLPRFVDFINFLSFFPQIVAGPIERRKDLLHQMEQFRFRWLPESINIGAGYLIAGLFLKSCMADNLANLFDPSSRTNPFSIWLANLVFGLRIYFDFAGYSLVAVGIGYCLGVRLTLNFTSPYCSTNLAEFWRRWHITLSQWFRDYVYIPAGGGRVRWWAANLLLVFVASGIWHGAGWNFVLWGLLHGLGLIGYRLLPRQFKLPLFIAWAATLAVTFLAWLCFYETNTAALLAKLFVLATPSSYNMAALKGAAAPWTGPNGLLLLVTLALAFAVHVAEWISLIKYKDPYCCLRRPGILLLLIVLMVVLSPSNYNDFIYFAF